MDQATVNLEEQFPITFPDEEARYVTDAIRSARCILEYGSGGSTRFAAGLEGKRIVSIESDLAWAKELAERIAQAGLPSQPEIIHADIGPTRKWGRPTNYSEWHKFVDYACLPWRQYADLDPDLILIDGRFRPACFVASLVSIKRSTLVIIDDYAGRPEYHEIEEITLPIERVGRMAVFQLEPREIANADFLRLVRYFFDSTESSKTKMPIGAMEAELSRLRNETGLLRDEVGKLRVVAREKALLENRVSRLKRMQRLILALASPVLVLLSPILLSLLVVYRYRKKIRSLTSSFKTKSKSVAVDAHEAFQAGGLDAALATIPSNVSGLPPALPEVFKAMAATTDEEWLAATNAWAAPRGAPKITLDSGNQPRFKRIRFAPALPVTDGDLVTVIMPCYNSQDTVERAVRSILDQSWRNVEVIAVNDASTDKTGEVLDTLAQEDDRLTVLHNSVNVGPYVSKNRALRIARGRYVTGHDADDLAFPDRIATQMAPILDNPKCLATIGHMVRLDVDGRVSRIGKVTSKTYDGICWIAFISLLIDRSVLMNEVGYWDSVRFGADSEILGRLTAVTGQKPARVDRLLMMCLWSSNSLTGDAVTGFAPDGRLSPVRRAYGDAWAAWHKSAQPSELRLDFPETERKFPAPPEMVVDSATIERLLAGDSVQAKPTMQASDA